MNRLDEIVRSLEKYERELVAEARLVEKQLAKTRKILHEMSPAVRVNGNSPRTMAPKTERKRRNELTDIYLNELEDGARFTVIDLLKAIDVPWSEESVHTYGSILTYRIKDHTIRRTGTREGRYLVYTKGGYVSGT